MFNEARFWRKVRKTNSCWIWTGCLNDSGYGITGIGKINPNGHQMNRRAHRVSWELVNGPIPEGFQVLHRCDIRNCVRPRHLFLGKDLDNRRDCIAKGRFPRGSTNGQSKLNELKVIQILRLVRTGKYTQEEIARKFGVHRMQISRIIRRATWKHVICS